MHIQSKKIRKGSAWWLFSQSYRDEVPPVILVFIATFYTHGTQGSFQNQNWGPLKKLDGVGQNHDF